MSTISGFNSLMAQAYNNPTTQIENAQRQAAINAAQVQAQREQASIPLIQQQTQAAQLENQQRRIQLNDMQGISAIYAKHADDDWTDPKTQEAFNADLAKSPVSWGGRLDYQNKMLQFQQAHLGLDENRLKLEEATNARAYEILSTFKNAPDATKPQLWAQSSAPALNRLGVGQFDPTNPPLGVALDSMIGNVGHQKAMLEEAKTKQETKGLAATQAETEAKTVGENLKNQLEQEQINHYKTLMSVPGALEAYVGRSVPRQNQAEFQATLSEAQQQPDLKGINEVVAKHGQNIREFEKTKALETDPQILAIRQKQQQAQASYQNALQQGDTARAKYFESLSDVQQSVATAATIQKVLDLSRSGNAIAGSQLKAMVPEFTNAVQDIKRMAASQGDKNLGSAQEHLSSEIASIAKGKPLSDSVMNEIAPYVQTIANGATVRHNATVDAISKAYPNFRAQHEPLPYASTTAPRAPGAGRKVGDKVTLKGGKEVTVTAVHPDGSFDAQ